MPLPLYINKFSSIFDKNGLIDKNEDIIWLMKKGMTICSLGLHTENLLK